jgi:uncharacterized protein with NRDE domain
VCTLILLHRPGAAWPVLLAANRDEMLARPWVAPAAHWPDLPGVVGGRDTLAGGTWLGVNAHGVVAGVLNRTGSLGPLKGKRSRGELPLLALRHASAEAAAAEAAGWDAGAWRSFNLIVADPTHAFFVRGLGEGPAQVRELAPGLTMIAATEPNDATHPRIARHLPAFERAEPPEPPDWKDWPALLSDAEGAWEQALNVPPRQGFGTASAALIAVRPGQIQYCFTPGPPGGAAWQAVPEARLLRTPATA